MNKSAKQNEQKPSAKQLNPLFSDKHGLIDSKKSEVNFKNISIPGTSFIGENIDILESKNENIINKQDFGLVKIHKADKKTLLEGDTDLFVFKEPSAEKTEEKKPILTQIPTSFENKGDIKKEAIKENIFLKQTKPESSNATQKKTVATKKARQSATAQTKKNYKKQQPSQKSSNLIIATLFLLILVSTVFVLQEANILDLSYIAPLLDNKNYNTEVINEITTVSGLMKSTTPY